MHAVELGDRAIEERLQPPAELVDTFDRPRRIVLQVLDDFVERRAGQDPLRDLCHHLLESVQLVPAPGVGVVEVEIDAVERARPERIALTTDGVALCSVWQVLLYEEPAEGRVRLGGALRMPLEPSAQRGGADTGALDVCHERQEERAGAGFETAHTSAC